MKRTISKPIVVGFAAVLLDGGILLRQHFRSPALAGTWVMDLGSGARSTSIVSPDGSFVCQTTGFSNRDDITFAGNIKVKGRVLTYTITSDSQPRAHVPRVRYGHVIRMDVHELVVKWDNTGTEAVFRKVPN